MREGRLHIDESKSTEKTMTADPNRWGSGEDEGKKKKQVDLLSMLIGGAGGAVSVLAFAGGVVNGLNSPHKGGGGGTPGGANGGGDGDGIGGGARTPATPGNEPLRNVQWLENRSLLYR